MRMSGLEFRRVLFRSGDIIKLAGASDDPRVGSVNTVNIGVDIAAVGLHRRRDRDRAGVRTAAAERRAAAVVHHDLEPGDNRDLTAPPGRGQRAGLDEEYARAAVGVLGADWQLP